jgi:hypothetical protein
MGGGTSDDVVELKIVADDELIEDMVNVVDVVEDTDDAAEPVEATKALEADILELDEVAARQDVDTKREEKNDLGKLLEVKDTGLPDNGLVEPTGDVGWVFEPLAELAGEATNDRRGGFRELGRP